MRFWSKQKPRLNFILSNRISAETRDGSVVPVCQYREHFTEIRDEILQPPLRLSAHIMEGRDKILETHSKSEEIIAFLRNFHAFADFIQ